MAHKLPLVMAVHHDHAMRIGMAEEGFANPEQVLPLLEPQLLPGLGVVEGLLVRFQPPLPARNRTVTLV